MRRAQALGGSIPPVAFMQKKPHRPRDLNQLAKMVGDLATGQAQEPEVTPVDPAASKRGIARATKLSPARRKAIAKKAARTRWGKKG